MRGYFGIGIYHGKKSVNIGTLWRSAWYFGAAYIFTIGRRYSKQASDVVRSWRKIPIFNYEDTEDFLKHRPFAAPLVLIELTDIAKPLSTFSHPETAIYLLGPEDGSLRPEQFSGSSCVFIPQMREGCLNVATAGSLVMYDRFVKRNG